MCMCMRTCVLSVVVEAIGGVQFMVKHHDKEGSDKGESKDDTCSSSEITEAWFSTFSLQLLEAVLKMSCG